MTVTGGPAGCLGSWSASSGSSWITITSGAGGSGSGSVTLGYAVASNPSSTSRSGSISIGGQTFTVNQSGSTSSGGCTPNDTTLCLVNGRFAVTASWRTNDNSGVGHAVALTSDTGYLWFFGSNNVEVVIKVLDACSLSRTYWVSAGGLTNVNVTINVRDTRTGLIKTYSNPMNTAFLPVQDTAAFATCQ